MQIDIDTSKERPQPIIYGSAEDWAASLEIILKWSPFSTEGELWQQVVSFESQLMNILLHHCSSLTCVLMCCGSLKFILKILSPCDSGLFC